MCWEGDVQGDEGVCTKTVGPVFANVIFECAAWETRPNPAVHGLRLGTLGAAGPAPTHTLYL